VLPAGHVLFHNFQHAVTISPQGDRIAFTATPLASSSQPGIGGFVGFVGRSSGLSFSSPPKIYVKSLDQWEVVQIPGTEWGIDPFFSPDGQSVAFVQAAAPGSASVSKRVSLSGGAPVVSVERLSATYMGAAWGAERNYCVFS
jgi:hypothetical protein